MTKLYDINRGLEIERIKKKWAYIFSFTGVFLVFVVCLITWISSSYLIMILDCLLVTGYLWFLYTYLCFYKKILNDEYHFLAKVEQFEHEIIKGYVEEVIEDVNTIRGIECYFIKIGNRTLYIEINKVSSFVYDGELIMFDVCDNFIVGYEVL